MRHKNLLHVHVSLLLLLLLFLSAVTWLVHSLYVQTDIVIFLENKGRVFPRVLKSFRVMKKGGFSKLVT